MASWIDHKPASLLHSKEEIKGWFQDGAAAIKLPVTPRCYNAMRQQQQQFAAATLVPVIDSAESEAISSKCDLDAWDFGSEQSTVVAVIPIIEAILRLISASPSGGRALQIWLNRTGPGTTSNAVVARARPDTIFICENCTVGVGEDSYKVLVEAVQEILAKREQLNQANYGPITGILSYAATQTSLAWYWIPADKAVPVLFSGQPVICEIPLIKPCRCSFSHVPLHLGGTCLLCL